MSFSEQTESKVQELIQAEYKNACVNWGEKYNSLHEGYAVLLEEIEESKQDFSDVETHIKYIWENIKGFENSIEFKVHLLCLCDRTINSVESSMKELAQVGAVLQKLKNT